MTSPRPGATLTAPARTAGLEAALTPWERWHASYPARTGEERRLYAEYDACAVTAARRRQRGNRGTP